MSRDGLGIYSAPAGTTATAGTAIESAKYNAFVADLVADANLARPIVAGGTGATTAAGILAATGVTASVAEVNVLDGVTATTAELNILDGVTATAAEINHIDGVTAPIQTQLDAKMATLSYPTLVSLEGLSLVAGDILYATAADTLTRLAKGTALQGLRMNAGATAPEWAAVQGRVLLATKTASASATLDFTEFDNATYRWYEFDLDNVKPATDATDFYARVSTNGGSSYNAGASDYSWTYGGTGTVALTQNDVTDGQMQLATNIGNAATEFGVGGRLILLNAASATTYTRLLSQIGYDSSAGDGFQLTGLGRRLAAEDTDAIRFLFSSGNITSGTIRMYGVI